MKDNLKRQKNQEDLKKFTSGEWLFDYDKKNDKVSPWAKKKKQTDKLAASHIRITKIDSDFNNRASKLLDCGSYLDFKRFVATNEMKLFRSNFCKYRLCPMCSWRRSLKIFGQASQVLDEAKKQGYQFIFVTLTQKNCEHKQLGDEITKIIAGLNNLMRRKTVSKVVHGWMRVIEITHNVDRQSKSFDTFHPHVHMIWAVKSTYFKPGKYISQAKLTDLWQKSMKLDYKPTSIDIRRVRTKGKGHVREVAKYSVKPGELINNDWDLMDNTVYTLDEALFNRRLLSWGGIIKKIRQSFKFDDPENGDLVNTDSDTIDNPELDFIIERYNWNFGYSQYVRSKEKFPIYEK